MRGKKPIKNFLIINHWYVHIHHPWLDGWLQSQLSIRSWVIILLSNTLSLYTTILFFPLNTAMCLYSANKYKYNFHQIGVGREFLESFFRCLNFERTKLAIFVFQKREIAKRRKLLRFWNRLETLFVEKGWRIWSQFWSDK